MRLAYGHDKAEALPVDPIDAEASSEQVIEHWLGMVSRLARLNDRDRTELQDELGAHLHDRVRDLELAGNDEHTALRRAIAELGDAAQLASNISEAHRYPRRRIIMNCTILGLGLAALGVGIVSVNGVGPAHGGRAFEVVQDTRVEHALPQKVDIEFNETLLPEALEYLNAMTDRSIYVHWDELFDYGIERDDDGLTLTLTLQNLPLGKAMDLMLLELPAGEQLAWRASEDLIELGIGETFDRRDVVLMSYDISETLQALWETYDIEFAEGRESITSLIMNMVEPDHWEDMGGAVARYNVVGGTMFIQAPPRMHDKIQWLLSELDSDAGVAVKDREHKGGQLPPAGTSAMFQAGDLVTVEVFELSTAGEWQTMTRLVDDIGIIRLPHIGDVSVANQTAAQIESDVHAKLSEILVRPEVHVFRTPPSDLGRLAELDRTVRTLEQQVLDLQDQLSMTVAIKDRLSHALKEMEQESNQLASDRPVTTDR